MHQEIMHRFRAFSALAHPIFDALGVECPLGALVLGAGIIGSQYFQEPAALGTVFGIRKYRPEGWVVLSADSLKSDF